MKRIVIMWIVVALCLIGANSVAKAATAYLATGGGAFGTIDLNTGVFTQLGLTSLPLAGLAVVGTTLYATDFNGQLYSVNPSNGNLTSIGSPTGIPYQAFGSYGGTLYAIDHTSANAILYSINSSTGAATRIGPTNTGQSLAGYWALSTNSTALYFTLGSNLYALNTTTGSATLVGSMGNSDIRVGAIAEVGGVLYAGQDLPQPPLRIVTLNKSTGAATVGPAVTGSGVSYIYGLAPTIPTAAPASTLFFPHVDTNLPWQTEIAIINTGGQTVTGTLRALSNTGQLVDTKAVTLSARGRRQITVATEFTNPTTIGYIVFDTDSTAVQGYTKFYQAGIYRAAIPAVREVNSGDIIISHIDQSALWWTGVSLVNTTSTRKDLTITFNNGQSVPYTLNANEHGAFTIGGLLNQPLQPDIKSAVITNASGVIGLELFGSGNQLDGLLITDKTATTIYYPHVASDNTWWTGIVAYNPSASAVTITITPYSAQGSALTPSTITIPAKGKYVGLVSALGLQANTAWFRIDSPTPLSGFELFATWDGQLLAAYAEGGTGAKAGIFPKIEKSGGWTGIAFVNTEASVATVTLTTYNDNGAVVATQTLTVGGYAKVVNYAETIFAGKDISSATYIAYSSDKNVVGFQLNGSADGMMLDGLPALAGNGNEMVLIPAGSFQMGGVAGEGDNSELPAHAVTLSAFYLDKYEVTKALWDEVYTWAIAHGYDFIAGTGTAANHPVQTVSWYDVVKWLNARSEKEGRTPAYYTDVAQTTATIYKTGQVDVTNSMVKWQANGYRLPTEAEWEYAARGGKTTRFYTGDCISADTEANYYGQYPWTGCPAGQYHVGTTPVGSFPANPWGLNDMAGNVWEWTWDWFGGYSSSAVTNPRGPDSGSNRMRVIRGGSWEDRADFLRSASRVNATPPGRGASIGFRSALSQP